MAAKMKCRIVTFEEVHNMVRRVSEEVKASGYKPTTVVGLARGGWVSARLICDFLGITDLISLKVEHWLQTGKTKDEATISYPFTGDLREKRLLVVDDITDTGKSLLTSTEYLHQFSPAEVRTATMQYVPQSKFRPDYFAEEVKVWTWFIYPWNWIEDTSTLIVRLMATQREKDWTLANVQQGLKNQFEIRWDGKMLRQMLAIMAERGQTEAVGTGKSPIYRLKDERVIQL